METYLLYICRLLDDVPIVFRIYYIQHHLTVSSPPAAQRQFHDFQHKGFLQGISFPVDKKYSDFSPQEF